MAVGMPGAYSAAGSGPKKPKAPVKKKTNPESLLQQYLKQGMSLDRARKKVSDQTGVWPNGYTN